MRYLVQMTDHNDRAFAQVNVFLLVLFCVICTNGDECVRR